MKRVSFVVALAVASATVGSVIPTVMAQGQQAAPPAAAAPQAQLPTSTSAEVNAFYTNIAGFITRAAAMVPAEKYTWQPTPEVRTFARLFAHIVDDNNGACAVLAGESPAPARMDTGTAGTFAANALPKADIEKALADSVARCQKAFAAVNQTNMMESAGGRGTRTKIGILMYNTSHINEHYGNIVTYMRLNGMVPPSSGGK